MNNIPTSPLTPAGIGLWVRQNNRENAAVKIRYMQAAKYWAQLIRQAPQEAWRHAAMYGAYAHLGREREGIRYLDKAKALLNLKRIQPVRMDLLVPRNHPRRRPDEEKARTLVRERILKEIGCCVYTMVLSPIVTGYHTWQFPIQLDWKRLRGPGRDRGELEFPCGAVRITRAGHLTDDRAIRVLKAVFHSFIGAFEIRRERDAFACIAPRAFGQVLIQRLIRRRGARPADIREQGHQVCRNIRIKDRLVRVEDYENRYVFCLPPGEFFDLLGLSPALRQQLADRERPLAVIAFNRCIAVENCEDPDHPDEALLKPEIHAAIMKRFTVIRRQIEAGHAYRIEPAYAFNYASGQPIPLPRLLTQKNLTADAFFRADVGGDSGQLHFKAASREIQLFMESQYRVLLDSLSPLPIQGTYRGKACEGPMLRPATGGFYSHIFQEDAIKNVGPMIYYDLKLAQSLMLTSLKLATNEIGMFNNNFYAADTPFDFLWFPLVWYIYDHSRDSRWLADCFPILERIHTYWDTYRFVRKVGLYTGKYHSPDYDYSTVGEERQEVFSPATNGSVYAFLSLMSKIARVLNHASAGRYRDQAETLRDRINRLCWDEEESLYFSYDAATGALFRTAWPDYAIGRTRHYSKDNVSPLYFGVPDQRRADAMRRPLNDQALYARYRAFPATPSGGGCDERRLRVWPAVNWSILQGLRMYGLHAEADRLSTDLFNMIFRSWYVYDNFPECFDATHGYLPEENVNVGGIGAISCPLLLLLDRIGINYSTRYENAGLTVRPVKQSGLGNLAFTATLAGRRTRVTFREGHGLMMK